MPRKTIKSTNYTFGKMNFFQEKPYVDDNFRQCVKKLDALKNRMEANLMPSVKEVEDCLNGLLQMKSNIYWNREAFVDKGLDFEFVDALDECIRNVLEVLAIAKRMADIEKEIDEIKRGMYQLWTISSSYGFMNQCNADKDLTKVMRFKTFNIYPLIYESGLRGTISTPYNIQPNSDSIEIHINFLGTVDFASKLVDLDEGGPGQVALRQHETRLLEHVNHVVEQMAQKYPDKAIRLRISGHSLGGALAKGFAHTMQRACAVLQDTPEKIIGTIKEEWTQNERNNPDPGFDDLKQQLESDAEKFKQFKALENIKGITVYALGAPGVSETTDKHGTLLTYYHDPDFIRLYHHHHKEDIMVKFGDTEFLSGKQGVPRMLANKEIKYDIAITPDEEANAGTLPFPHITKHVMAAHNKTILGSNVKNVEIVELEHSKEILNKFVFLPIHRFLLAAVFQFAKFLASFESIVKSIPELGSLPVYNVGKPEI